MLKNDFWSNWHSFGSSLYRYKEGRWVPTTEDAFTIELANYNRTLKRKMNIKKWILRIVFFLLGAVSTQIVLRYFGA